MKIKMEFAKIVQFNVLHVYETHLIVWIALKIDRTHLNATVLTVITKIPLDIAINVILLVKPA